jgi:hypothetical protein
VAGSSGGVATLSIRRKNGAIWFQLVKVLTQFSDKPTIGHVDSDERASVSILGAQRLRRIDANSSKRRTDRS